MSESMSDQEKSPSMTEPESPDDFDRRLQAARARESEAGPSAKTGNASMSGLGLAMRMATEMVAGVGVGAGIGWGIDHMVGSSPWATLVFTVLGWVAGMMNAYRAIKGLDDTVGFGAAERRRLDADKDEEKGAGGV